MENPFKIDKNIILVDSQLTTIKGGDIGSSECSENDIISDCVDCPVPLIDYDDGK